jgi:hypothetical protein
MRAVWLGGTHFHSNLFGLSAVVDQRKKGLTRLDCKIFFSFFTV